MRRIYTILTLVLCSFSLYAQDEAQTVTLDEVTVKGAKVVSKVDGQMIYPTDAQKKAVQKLEFTIKTK